MNFIHFIRQIQISHKQQAFWLQKPCFTFSLLKLTHFLFHLMKIETYLLFIFRSKRYFCKNFKNISVLPDQKNLYLSKNYH